jgi:hypothetical protein
MRIRKRGYQILAENNNKNFVELSHVVGLKYSMLKKLEITQYT